MKIIDMLIDEKLFQRKKEDWEFREERGYDFEQSGP